MCEAIALVRGSAERVAPLVLILCLFLNILME